MNPLLLVSRLLDCPAWRRAAGFGSIALAALMLGGCASKLETIDYNLVTTNVKPMEYAEVLCRGLPMSTRHTCMTRAIEHYRERVRVDGAPSDGTTAPFAMVFNNGDFYLGRYVSNPFASAFTVRNDRHQQCRGRYDAFRGDRQPIFRIHCDDGGTGAGNIILDLGGRNGVGEFRLDDGRRGNIAFGYAGVDQMVR